MQHRFTRKGQLAVNFLLRRKSGEVPDALFNKGVGWIDLIWGETGTAKSDGYGLSKIAKYHPEVLPRLARIIRSLKVISKSENRYNLGSKEYIATVRREFDGKKKVWLLTAFKKKTR